MLFVLFFLPACVLHVAGQTINAPAKADLPPEDEIWYRAVHQESDGSMRYLRGGATVELSDVKISADEIEFNSDTNEVVAKGHVRLQHYVSGDDIHADHGTYNLKTEVGKFYDVDGTSPAKIVTSPGVLTTTNPFYFHAQYADRIKDRYILHNGFLTDCKIPKPWWTFDAPVFDVIPGDRAIGRRTLFRFRGLPVFYLPYFYRPLGKHPRSSGFLTPEFGHSSLYGWVYGAGYYWAINPSYDMTAIVQDFTARGPLLRYDFRGKPNEVTDFNFYLFGLDDIKGTVSADKTIIKQGGTEFEVTARTQLWGFNGVLDYNYLSSLTFREVFAPAFSYPLWAQNNSIGYLTRHFQDDVYAATLSLDRNQLFEQATPLKDPANQVIIQKLPMLDFTGREQEVVKGPLPVWFSFGSSAGLLNRSEPTGPNTTNPIILPLACTAAGDLSPCQIFKTGEFSRIDLEPRVATEFSYKGFSLMPSLNLGATDYSNSYAANGNNTVYTPINPNAGFINSKGTFQSYNYCNDYPDCTPNSSTTVKLANSNLLRKDLDFVLDFRPPSVEKVFTPPKWLHLGQGVKLKHVIETEAKYEDVSGVNEFRKTVLFDGTDILTNTNQLTLSLTNRIYRKDKNGNVAELITWKLAQARYFDPTFGGVVTPNQTSCAANPYVPQPNENPFCQRAVVLATEEFSPFPFLDQPRNYSPISSILTVNPYTFFGVDWRSDYDPLRHSFVDQSVSANVTHKKLGFHVTDAVINENPVLVPHANQAGFGGSYGSANRKGWNVSATTVYDLILERRLIDFVTASYNTDCCGFSFQLRNFNLGLRNDNQYLFSFSLANIGTFGSLPKQARQF